MFNKIAEHFKDFKFVWIGDGKLRNKLTSPNIEVIGWRTEEEVLKLANNYDIFLLPSKWEGRVSIILCTFENPSLYEMLT